MRILITGAGGMLGSVLKQAYAKDSCHAIHPLARCDVDLRDAAATCRKFEEIRPDLVVHAAAMVGGIGGNAAAPAEYFYENLLMNSNVIEASRRAGARKIVALGSVAVYSDSAPRPFKEEDIWLGAPHPSEASYGHAKRTMLAHLEACRLQYGLDFVFCVLTNTFGPNDRFDEVRGHVVPALLSKFLKSSISGEPVEVWGTGAATRDFIFASDAAEAIYLAGERASGSINIASGQPFAIADIVAMLQEISGFTGKIAWDRTKPDGQAARQYDVGKLRALGFRPRHGLKAALAETFQWLRLHSPEARR